MTTPGAADGTVAVAVEVVSPPVARVAPAEDARRSNHSTQYRPVTWTPTGAPPSAAPPSRVPQSVAPAEYTNGSSSNYCTIQSAFALLAVLIGIGLIIGGASMPSCMVQTPNSYYGYYSYSYQLCSSALGLIISGALFVVMGEGYFVYRRFCGKRSKQRVRPSTKGVPGRDLVYVGQDRTPVVVPRAWMKIVQALPDEKINELYDAFERAIGSSATLNKELFHANFLATAVPQTRIEPIVSQLVALFCVNLPTLEIAQTMDSCTCPSSDVYELRSYMATLPPIVSEFYGIVETYGCFSWGSTVAFSYQMLCRHIAQTCDLWQVAICLYSNYPKEDADKVWDEIRFLTTPVGRSSHIPFRPGGSFTPDRIQSGVDSSFTNSISLANWSVRPVVHNVFYGLVDEAQGEQSSAAFFDVESLVMNTKYQNLTKASLTSMTAMAQVGQLIYPVQSTPGLPHKHQPVVAAPNQAALLR